MKTIAIVLAASVLVLGAAARAAAQTRDADVQLNRAIARRIPIGATVVVTTRDERRLKAVLFAVDDDGITVKPATRVPVAARRIAYERIDALERDEGRLHIGRYLGIGAAIGGAALLVLLAIAG